LVHHWEDGRCPPGVTSGCLAVFGAAHIPAVVDYLTETFRYYVENASWLTVAHAPD